MAKQNYRRSKNNSSSLRLKNLMNSWRLVTAVSGLVGQVEITVYSILKNRKHVLLGIDVGILVECRRYGAVGAFSTPHGLKINGRT